MFRDCLNWFKPPSRLELKDSFSLVFMKCNDSNRASVFLNVNYLQSFFKQRAQDATGQPQQTASVGATPVNPASIPTRRTIQLQRAGALPTRPPLSSYPAPARLATFHPIVSPPGFSGSSPGMAAKPKPKSSILYSTQTGGKLQKCF